MNTESAMRHPVTRRTFLKTGAIVTVGMTAPSLTTRFPGQELLWDSANCRFTNHDQANHEVLSRNYREGFAPPKVG